MAGQFGGWTPIGAEQTASGYQVAWKLAGVDQYRCGAPTAAAMPYPIAPCVGNQRALQSIETSFHQDLNGDGAIGVPDRDRHRGPARPAWWGSAPTFFSIASAPGPGPSLKYAGADVVAGQIGGWTPIGAEQTASGYEVAWKVAGADQYSVWSTDSSGNSISSRRYVGNQRRAAINRDQFPSGLERRRCNRYSGTGTVIESAGRPAWSRWEQFFSR